MDVLGPFPESNRGNQVMLIVADYFTKWLEAFLLPNKEAETVARKLVGGGGVSIWSIGTAAFQSG